MAKLGRLSELGLRALLAAAAAGAFSLTATAAHAGQRTFTFLTTGNGHGFQYFDSNQNKIVAFLEHPYRYLRPNPTDPTAEGVIRRNLAYDFYFGIQAGATAGWLNAPTQAGDPEYLDQSNIIHAPAQMGSTAVDSYFFAPFGYEGNALIALLHAPGASDAYVLFNFHMGTGTPDTPDSNGESISAIAGQHAVVETGPGGGAMVYVPLSGVDHQDCAGVAGKIGQTFGDNTSCSGNDVVPGFQKALGQDGWFAVAALYIDDPGQAATVAKQVTQWANGRMPDRILSDAQAEFESWRKPPSSGVVFSSDNEKKVWRQSEAVLRMAQIREPSTSSRRNTGMILASLPPGPWHTGWVRDAMHAIVALSRSGHFAEAKAALNFFMSAGPVGKYASYVNNQHYLLSVCRYFGSGEEEADYSGQPTPNVEMDGWGMIFWAARAYVEFSGDVAWLGSQTSGGQTVYQALIGGIATPLENNLEPNHIVKADSSIWEVHDANKRHFAFTTMAAARGYCDLAALAGTTKQDKDHTHYKQLAVDITTALLGTFVDPQGALGGSLEGLSSGTYYDGSLAEAFTWNLLPDYSGKTATATLNMFDNLKVASGGFKRDNDGLSSYDDNEWILVDLRISDALRRAGRGSDADGYVATLVDKASANFFLLPELYNAVAADGPIGNYTGSIPMVGYGGGAYINTLLDRAGLIEPNDCDGFTPNPDGGSPVMPGQPGGPPGSPLADAGASAGNPAAKSPVRHHGLPMPASSAGGARRGGSVRDVRERAGAAPRRSKMESAAPAARELTMALRDAPSDIPLLEMLGIAKSFGGVHALRGADLCVSRREIHALVGENGAGKSTLLKVLAGAHAYDAGAIRIDGKDPQVRSPAEARAQGIAMVHQELMLVPELSVAENLFLGREPLGRFRLLDGAKLEADAGRLLAEYGFADAVDPAQPVSSLGIGLQQVVEIVRALSQKARLLVLDEPTAALTSTEAERLMQWLRALRAAGTSTVYVSHRMDEVFALADRITVLRDGKTVDTLSARETTPEAVVLLMVGREVKGALATSADVRHAAPALEVVGLRLAPSVSQSLALDDITLGVRKGEVVGLCGAMGSGRTALLSTLFGCAEGVVSGTVRVDGAPLMLQSPAEAIAHGVALLPEDRKGKGLVLGLSVRDNLALPTLAHADVIGSWARFGLVNDAAIDLMAGRRIRALGIRGDSDALVSTLSGGNQQKVALGKWLERPPSLLLLDEPTRGVDVGAREEIYGIIEELRRRGVAILLASSDLPEVLRLAQRILVLRRGRLIAEMSGADASLEAIVRLTTGAVTPRARTGVEPAADGVS